MKLDPLSQSMTWGNMTWSWPRGQPWHWSLPNKKIDIIRSSLMRGLQRCLNVESMTTFGWVMSQQQNPTFGTLTWPLRSPVDLRLVPIAGSRNERHNRLFFCDVVTQLGAKRRWRSHPGNRYVWRGEVREKVRSPDVSQVTRDSFRSLELADTFRNRNSKCRQSSEAFPVSIHRWSHTKCVMPFYRQSDWANLIRSNVFGSGLIKHVFY